MKYKILTKYLDNYKLPLPPLSYFQNVVLNLYDSVSLSFFQSPSPNPFHPTNPPLPN